MQPNLRVKPIAQVCKIVKYAGWHLTAPPAPRLPGGRTQPARSARAVASPSCCLSLRWPKCFLDSLLEKSWKTWSLCDTWQVEGSKFSYEIKSKIVLRCSTTPVRFDETAPAARLIKEPTGPRYSNPQPYNATAQVHSRSSQPVH